MLSKVELFVPGIGHTFLMLWQHLDCSWVASLDGEWDRGTRTEKNISKWAKNGGREGIIVKSWLTIGDIATQSTVRKEGKGAIPAQVKGTVFVAHKREGREECEENQPARTGSFIPTAMGWWDGELSAPCSQGDRAVSPRAQTLSPEPGLHWVQEERCDRRLGWTQHTHVSQSTRCTYGLWTPRGKWSQPLWPLVSTLPVENNRGTCSITRLGFKLVLIQAELLWDQREEMREFKRVPLNTT